MTSRFKAAAQRINGFHWAAAASLLALGAAGAVAAWQDPVAGLNGALIIGAVALLSYAAARVFGKVAALVRPVSGALITFGGVLGASMLILTAIRIGFGWILIAPGIAGVVGLAAGVIRAVRQRQPRLNREQRRLLAKQKASKPATDPQPSALHMRVAGLLGAVLVSMAAAAAIASPALIGLLTQVAYVGGSLCLGVALFGAGEHAVALLRERDAKLPAVMTSAGRVLTLFTLYTIAAAAPYALLTFVLEAFAA